MRHALAWWHHGHGGKVCVYRLRSEQENRDTLERYRQEFFERQNIDAIDDLMHDDYVEEYPSGARGFAARTMHDPSMRIIQEYRTWSITATC